jgi:polysaccharide pyruvyl transferase WcaK-like protein
MTASTMKLSPRRDRREIPRNAGQEAEAGSPIASRGRPMNERARGPKKIAFFGHFDGTNFGNECSLQTILYHLHRLQPEAHVTCICSGPQTTASTYHIRTLPFNGVFRKPWAPRSRLTRVTRKIHAGLRLPFQLFACIRSIRDTDMLVIPGTGLLTDAYGLRGWGPYGLLKWSLIAKACGCKVALVSVGAGPIHGTIARWCIRLILSLAEFRSYRDTSTVRYLQGIGLVGDDEAVFPDLAFSLPECMIPRRNRPVSGRPVVGLGVMEYPGRYAARGPTEAAFPEYLEALVESSRRLLERGYDIRLLSGDLADSDARRAFRRVLQERFPAYNCDRIIDEPVASVMDVLSQIASTDFVVATRFHNILFGFMCGKPVISISFHHKCESLMAMMGMSDYCLEMGGLKADQLIDTLCRLEANALTLGPSIRERITAFQKALDQQYDMLFATTRQAPRAAELIPD